jgi:hypothetical protein
MSNVYIETIPIPRIARNKRIYAGNVSTTKVTNNMLDPLHIEWATLSELISSSVVVIFKQPFTIVPAGWIKVYRMREIVTGRWKQQDVLYYHAASDFKNEFGFGLVIDPKESLTGVIIEYFFI